jgi:DNA-binding response OmpR family regulator
VVFVGGVISDRRDTVAKRVLIVEDEERIRSIYRSALAATGCAVLEAATAGEGYDLLQRVWVDLVILDIRMPEVDWAALGEVVRQFFRGSKLLVASVYPVEDQRNMVPGAVDYFDKTEGIEVLVEKVLRHLEGV